MFCFQTSQTTWTSGSPLAFQSFDTSHMKPQKWRLSWKQYVKFLDWYHLMLRNAIKADKWTMDFFQFFDKDSELFVSGKKAELINSLITLTRKSKSWNCVLMLLWHKTYTHWIKIPCHSPALERSSVFCTNVSKVSLFLNKTRQANVTRHKSEVGQDGITNIFLCKDGSYISSQLLCDLKPNCVCGKDETLCKTPTFAMDIESLLKKDQTYEHSHAGVVNRLRPRLTHKDNLCSSSDNKCVYDVMDKRFNRSQTFCPSGVHLAECEDIHCETMFKCPHHYCLPWRFVCDGYWDCPLGYDEEHCLLKSMPGFFHCHSSCVHIMLHSLCDNILDCPGEDDETNCDLNNTVCPLKCSCFRYSLICSNFTLQDSYQIEDMPHRFVVLSGNLLMNQLLSALFHFKHLVEITLLSHDLKEFCISNAHQISGLVYLNAPGNSIQKINSFCFESVLKMKCINLSNNNISQIKCNAFAQANVIEIINLTRNSLKDLKQCIFDSLLHLKELDIFDNNLILDNKNLFSAIPTDSLHVRSSNSLVCCFEGNVKCSEEKENLQCSLLQGKHTSIAFWVVSSCGLLINAFYFGVHVCRKGLNMDQKIAFKYLVTALYLSHILLCTHLFFVGGANAFYKNNYVFAKSLWYHTLLCLLLSFPFLFSVCGCLISNSLIVAARFMVVHHPLNSMFKRSSPVKRVLLLTSSAVFLLALLFDTADSESLFNDGHCLPIGNIRHSALSKTITLFLIVLGVISSIAQPVAYASIVTKVKQSHSAASIQKSKSCKRLIITSCLSSMCNLLCWLSTAILWLIYFFSQEEGKKMLVTWSLVTTLPINVVILPFLT